MNKIAFAPFVRSIRFQLLLVVNSVMFLMLLGLLVFDYQRELSSHFREKQTSLKEEAKTLLPSILHLRTHGSDGVQAYLDDVCEAMGDTDSHSHHIAVELDGQLFQAQAHDCRKCEMGSTMKLATANSDWRFQIEGQEFLVGMESRGGISVLVAQDVSNVASTVFFDLMLRMSGLMLMGLVAALIMNFTLIRLVSQPLGELVKQVREIGSGNFDVHLNGFGNTELDFLSSEVKTMSTQLAASEQERKIRLNKARRIQENLLPDDINTAGLEISTIYWPAEEVGGDYFDILPHGEQSWLICMADVTGHGVPAAMTAAMLKTLLLQTKGTSESPAEILLKMNRVFMDVNLIGDFASIILVRLDLQAKQLTYANAGHDPAWSIDADGKVHELLSTGTLLGIDENTNWTDEAVEFTDRCRLAISTDGITETFDSDDEQFGKQRLLEVLLTCDLLSASEMASRVQDDVNHFRGSQTQTDDVTLLLVNFTTAKTRSNSGASDRVDAVVDADASNKLADIGVSYN